MTGAIGSIKSLLSLRMNTRSERRSVGRTKIAKSALLFFGLASRRLHRVVFQN
jgi:hypothetical protein